MTQPTTPKPASRRTLMLAGAGLAVAVAIGLVIALTGGSDSPGDDLGSAGGVDGAARSFGRVGIEGAPLAPFASTSDDAAGGEPAPVISGEAPDGPAVTVGAPGRPTMIAFLAHWCPHCQRELPVLVALMRDGSLDDVRVVALLTGTNRDAPNYPPAAWLGRERWTGDVLLDDEANTAAQRYGLGGYPFLVFLHADGTVAARTSGELPAKDIVALVKTLR